MSVLYLVRHAQGGTRDNYDYLSELGRRQARLLGEYFEAQQLEFDRVYSGNLNRQRATAAETFPEAEITVDSGWDEFDLTQVYSEYAPHLASDDAEFRSEYEEMQAQVAMNRDAHSSPVHRRWFDCDVKVVRAWVDSRYDYSGETWPMFVTRVQAAFARAAEQAEGSNTIVFTSATPIGVCTARALEIEDGRAMRLAGVLLNASFSTLHIRSSEIRLFSFNNAPHLLDATLRTFR